MRSTLERVKNSVNMVHVILVLVAMFVTSISGIAGAAWGASQAYTNLENEVDSTSESFDKFETKSDSLHKDQDIRIRSLESDVTQLKTILPEIKRQLDVIERKVDQSR